MTERVRGLVVSTLDVSDSLRYVHMITLEKGRLSAGVRGSMKFRGRFGVAIMPMTYSEFVLYSSDGNSYWLNEATLITSFFGLSEDYDRLSLGSYVVDAANYMSVEGQPDPELLNLALNTLWLILNRKSCDLRLIKAAFELRAAAIGGFTPDTGGCRDCGCDCTGRDCYLSVADGCLICADCAKQRRLSAPDGGEFRDELLPVSPPVLAAIRYVSYADAKKIYSFTLDRAYIKQFAKLGEVYLARQLDYRFPTLDLLDLPEPDAKTPEKL